MASGLLLRRAERKKLLSYYRRHPSPDVRLRAHVLLMLADGRSWREIRSIDFVSYDTIAHFKDRFIGHRMDSLLGKTLVSRSRWSEEAEAILRQALALSPDKLGYLAVNWTVPLLRKHIEHEWGQRPSDLQVRRVLNRLNYVWKRPGLDLRGANSPKIKRQLRIVRQKVRKLPRGVVKLFEDETDLLLFPPIRAGWFERGKPAKVTISGWNAKRTVFGTIDLETGHRTLIVRSGICAADFHAELRAVRDAYGNRKVAMLLDKASRHTAASSITLAAQLGIHLIWLPPHSTNVNPMDRLWRWGKERICANRQHSDIDSQAQMFVEYLLSLSPQEALRKAGMLSGRFWLCR